jgi:glycosyltransferase involved in cell wall biosynthesis
MSSSAHTAPPLRVLVVDHVAPVASVRRRWTRVARQAHIDLTLVSPHAWPENSQWNVHSAEPDEPYRTIVGRVTVPGREVRSVYLGGLARAMRESRPEVIVMMEEAFSAFAVQVLALRRLYAPTARISFYACWILPYEQLWYRPAPFFRWLARTMHRRLDAAMCINDAATRALHAEGFHRARTNFFGVDETLFARIPRDRARAALGLDPDETIFLYAGRLLELKGIDDLVDAFVRLASKRPDRPMRLIVLGAGEHEPALRDRASRATVADRIELRGSVANEQIRTYMCAADAFVLPSRAAWCEQFGRVLAEAMLVETPVVGSTSGEIPAVIGEGGFVYPADDVDALASTLERLLDEPDEVGRRATLGRDRALAEFSVDAFVRRTIDLIEELSGRSVRSMQEELATP